MVKAFDPNGKFYDQETLQGRFLTFFNLINPRSLFYSEQTYLNAKTLLKSRKENPEGTFNDQELWRAKSIIQSIQHPDTKEPIPKLFRLSCFLPANIPIMVGMLLMPKTPFTVGFWQWVNQTYNVGFNYNNRSIDQAFSNTKLLVSYGLATSSSIVVASFLDKIILNKVGNSMVARTLAPVFALSIAGCLNMLVVRYKELFDGVKVTDNQGNELGMSTIAGRDGLKKTLGIRFFMQFPLCFAPVLTVAALQKIRLVPRSPMGKGIFQIGIVAANLMFMLPLCFAAYPQIQIYDKLEPHLKSDNIFKANRGL